MADANIIIDANTLISDNAKFVTSFDFTNLLPNLLSHPNVLVATIIVFAIMWFVFHKVGWLIAMILALVIAAIWVFPFLSGIL